MSEKTFLVHWFSGVNHFLERAAPDALAQFVGACASACSASYSRGVYEQAFESASKAHPAGPERLRAGLDELARIFPDFAYTLHPDRIEIRYSHCGCDLVTEKLLSSPKLCLCSVQSLRENWELIHGKGLVDVGLEESILQGGHCCRFSVRLHPLQQA